MELRRKNWYVFSVSSSQDDLVQNKILNDFFLIGFQDAFHSLDRLTHVHFNLPVDLAVRQFQNMKDAF